MISRIKVKIAIFAVIFTISEYFWRVQFHKFIFIDKFLFKKFELFFQGFYNFIISVLLLNKSFSCLLNVSTSFMRILIYGIYFNICHIIPICSGPIIQIILSSSCGYNHCTCCPRACTGWSAVMICIWPGCNFSVNLTMILAQYLTVGEVFILSGSIENSGFTETKLLLEECLE